MAPGVMASVFAADRSAVGVVHARYKLQKPKAAIIEEAIADYCQRHKMERSA